MVTTEETKLQQALVRGSELLVQHGIGDWRVSFHRKRRVLADCNHMKKTIRYSLHFITIATKEQLEGVTLHEIAHALVGVQHGHDNVFRRKVLELGGDPDYASASVKNPVFTHKYNLTCPECGWESHCNRNKSYRCTPCARKGIRTPMNISENQLKVVLWPV